MKNIVILGAPGPGEDTQSDRSVAKHGLGHISMGDVLRSEIKNGTELGKTAKIHTDRGQLVPDELMIDILTNVYNSFSKGHKEITFDDFPRTIPQIGAPKQILAGHDCCVAATIELDVPEDELMKRLILCGRRNGRTDDSKGTIKRRLNVYHFQTAPLIERYKKEGIHHCIDGLGELGRVMKDITSEIDKL